MTIEYSGSTTEYKGTYKKIYRIDRSGIEKSKRELKEKLGPSYENYFKVNFKLMSQKYVIFHITGRNEFVSKSRYGDKRYTAFAVNKDIKFFVNTYDSKEIEKEKQRGIFNEVNHWNGQRHYYLSPGGRHISRLIKTSRRDFNITLKSLLEVKRPQRIDVFSKLSPNNKINLVNQSNRTKVCVKCGNAFIPIYWNGWTIKYLSLSNVYVCENCNKNLKEIIISEKIKRSTYESEKSGLETKLKSLKMFLKINLSVMLPSIFLISYYIILFLSLFSCLTASLIAFYLKLKQSSKKLNQIIILERSRRIEVLDSTKCIDIASLLEDIDLIKEKNQIIKPIKQKQKIEPLKSKSYDFNGFILTIYDSNNKRLATIPRERFNKKDSSFYYCECGKYYLSSNYLFKHLINSTDCIDLFLFTQAEEKISSITIKTTLKIAKTKDQEKTQLLEITDKNILKTLNDKPIIFKDLSSKFIIKDAMDERYLKYKLKALVRKEYASQEFLDNNLQFNWKLNPNFREREKAELTEKDSIAINILNNYSYYPKTLICYKNSHIIVKKGIYNFIPEISQFLKTLDGDLKREFFRTEAYKWRRKLNLLNLNSDRKKEEYVSILHQDLEESGSIEKDVDLLLDLDKNLIFFNEGDTNLDIIVKSDWALYNTISTSKESFKKKINNYLN